MGETRSSEPVYYPKFKESGYRTVAGCRDCFVEVWEGFNSEGKDTYLALRRP